MAGTLRRFLTSTAATIRRVTATAPILAVAIALHIAWFVGTFALWNSEMARIQDAADAAALAAISANLTEPPGSRRETAIENAETYATLNNPRGHPQDVEVAFGIWDAATGEFSPAEGSFTAIRVTIERTGILGAFGDRVFADWLGWSGGGARQAVAEGAAADRSRRTMAKIPRLVK